jgi:hypothetical protein
MNKTKRLKYQRLIKNYKDNNGISKMENKLSAFNSKSCNIKEFKKFIKNKNKLNEKLLEKYKVDIFRKYKWYSYINRKRTETDLVKEIKMPKVFHQIRGSTSESIFNNERWFIVHAVSHETNRYYYHMIVVFYMNYELLRYTSLFSFQEKNIEFFLSLIVEEDRVIITNSAMDKSSLINVYDKKYIDSLFISF